MASLTMTYRLAMVPAIAGPQGTGPER
jgi:hypothetical protein